MNCEKFRATVGAEPRRTNPDLEAHAAGCTDCTAWRREVHRLDEVMRRALTIDVDTGRVHVPTTAPRHAWRGWAMAAGVVCATLAAALLWFANPRTSLAQDVVAHMSEEPDAWARTEVAADPAKVAQVLARSGVRLKDGVGLASYANSCWFRGHHVPHLVFQTDDGPVTVMVLAEEHVSAPVEFDEEGYRGVLVPAQHGAVAILARGTTPGREFTTRLQAALVYTSPMQ